MARPVLDYELITAVVTPFKSDLSVDYEALERLIRHLIATGSDGILLHGSTGESPTVSLAEKLEITRIAKTVLAEHPGIKLILGCGTNDTRATVDACREWAGLSPDALLVVVPYYNKPSQNGMVAHFGAVAQAVDVPIIIYNIPGRTVVNMLPETVAILAERYENIVGVKQSNADLDQAGEIQRLTADAFRLWAGDDSLALPMMALGAQGVVSVASHLTGRPIRDMITAFKRGDIAQARQLHLAQLELFRELFFLPNPTVVKTCLARLGLIEPYLRLPLVLPEEAELVRIDRLMQTIERLVPHPTTA